MAHAQKTITDTVATDASVSSGINVSYYDRVAIQVPTYNSFSDSSTVTTKVEGYNPTTAGWTALHQEDAPGSDWTVGSGNGSFLAPVKPAGYVQKVRLLLDATATSTMTCYWHCNAQA